MIQKLTALGATEDDTDNQTEVDSYLRGEGKKQTKIQIRSQHLSNMEKTVLKPEHVWRRRNELTGDRTAERRRRELDYIDAPKQNNATNQGRSLFNQTRRLRACRLAR